MIVWDAGSGLPVSFNREAKRILNALRHPDQSPEELLRVLTFRRGDGREVSLEQISVAQAQSQGEAVRVEEIVLRVPDGNGNPEEVPRLLKEHRPRLVLLDLMLPEVDGLELMRHIFEAAGVPVLVLSAYGQDEVIARAFDAGAADYVVKPFSPTELTARIRAALRRGAPPSRTEPTEPCVLGELTIDYVDRRVTVGRRRVRLTDLEYRLLVELSIHLGRVVTYQELLQRVWDAKTPSDLRPLRSALKSLRRKLGDDPKNPAYIFNEVRVGYCMGRDEQA